MVFYFECILLYCVLTHKKYWSNYRKQLLRKNLIIIFLIRKFNFWPDLVMKIYISFNMNGLHFVIVEQNCLTIIIYFFFNNCATLSVLFSAVFDIFPQFFRRGIFFYFSVPYFECTYSSNFIPHVYTGCFYRDLTTGAMYSSRWAIFSLEPKVKIYSK